MNDPLDKEDRLGCWLPLAAGAIMALFIVAMRYLI